MFLPSGGSLIIDRTEAMTVIDVNTGKFTGTGGNLEATVTSNNLEAAEEIVRQLRLRDIGGIIVIDFIDMVLPSNRELLLRRLVECLGRDRTRHQVAEMTSLGLVQMTRKRIGTGLLEAFTTECPRCHGRGYELHDMPVETQRHPDGGRATRVPATVGPTREQCSAEKAVDKAIRAGQADEDRGVARRRPGARSRRARRSRRSTADNDRMRHEQGRPAVVPDHRGPTPTSRGGATLWSSRSSGPGRRVSTPAKPSANTRVPVDVTVLDRLPVPFGLVRYGVAPDHPSIRSIRNTLERTLERPASGSTVTWRSVRT